MKEEKILDFLEEFGTLSEGMSDEQRIELMTSMLEKLPEEDQDAVLNYCSSEEDCDCCDCEEEIEDERLTELKVIEKELEITASELALQEEVKRINNLENEFKIPQYIKDSELFKRVETECASITHSFRMLLKAGIDYQNALIMAQNSVTNYNNKELAKINAVNNSMNQI